MSLKAWTPAGLPLKRWEHYPKVSSTNTVAREWAAGVDDIELPLLVTCDRQIAGRGRGGKSWTHEPGNLAFSIVTASDPATSHWLALWTAICLHQTARYFLPTQQCTLKWPNDLLIDGRKNAGILIEKVGPRLRTITGVGLNLTQPTSEIEDGQAVFSWSEAGQEFESGHVLHDFLARWLKQDFQKPNSQQAILDYFGEVDHLAGHTIEVVQAGKTTRGPYLGLSSQGFLQMAPEDERPGAAPVVIPSCDRVRRVDVP